MALDWRQIHRTGQSWQAFDEAGRFAYSVHCYRKTLIVDGRVRAGPEYWRAFRNDIGGRVSDTRWSTCEQAKAEAETHHHAMAVHNRGGGHGSPPG